jgi:anti-sigma-K factor RskA
MDRNALYQKLIAAARANPPSEGVPYAFEKRIMARLSAPLAVDEWAVWGKALWRAAASCLAVAAVLAICTFILPEAADNTASDLENAVILAVDHAGDGE